MRDIKNYEGLYAITSCGKVWSYRRKKFLKPWPNANGYLRVNLRKDKEVKSFFIHRLVAEAYIPNPNNYDTVDHIDFDRTNNCVNNLQWMSLSENSRKRRNCRSNPIRCIELNTIYPSVTEAGRCLNLDKSSISKVCLGKRKTTGGYHWEYVKEEIVNESKEVSERKAKSF